MRDRVSQAIVGIAVAGFLLRVLYLLHDGPTGPVGYDDSVYFSGAGLLASGRTPYDDFVLLHPPGILILAAPIAFLGDHLIGYLDAFTLARWLTCAVGGVNTALVGVIARRWRGGAAGVVAAALYATFPPATEYEGFLLLEPLVNLFVLAAVLRWLSPTHATQRLPDLVLVGSLIGFAAAIKLNGGSMLLAFLLVGPFTRVIRDRALLIASAAGAFLVVALPFALQAGIVSFVEQTIVTQVERPSLPGDIQFSAIHGVFDRSLNLLGFLPDSEQHLPALVGVLALALGALIATWAWLRGGRDGRFLAVAWALVLAQLLLTPKYYPHYGLFLAPVNCVLLGGAAQSVYESIAARPAILRRSAAVAVAVLPAISAATILADGIRQRSTLRDLETGIPADACLYADPPVLALAADRLPTVADPFGERLHLAELEQDPETETDAMLSEPAQGRLREIFATCGYAQLARPPELNPSWTDTTRVDFLERFELVPGTVPLGQVWRHRP